MAFYDKFPYTNFQELNLDEIIRRVVSVEEGLQFVIDNASLKYADPIQWNITSQYQANTVVIDPATNIAYISTKPVPDNILITDTDYWTPIFDLTDVINDITQEYDTLDDKIDDEIQNRIDADTALQNNIDAVIPDDGTAGMVLTKTADGYDWEAPEVESLKRKMLIHRGFTYGGNQYAQDNSIIAFNLCGQFGYGGFECDPRKDANGVIVLLHDADVSSVSNTSGLITTLSYANVKYKSKYNDVTEVGHLTTLHEALLVAQSYDMFIMFDMGKNVVTVAEIVAECEAVGFKNYGFFNTATTAELLDAPNYVIKVCGNDVFTHTGAELETYKEVLGGAENLAVRLLEGTISQSQCELIKANGFKIILNYTDYFNVSPELYDYVDFILADRLFYDDVVFTSKRAFIVANGDFATIIDDLSPLYAGVSIDYRNTGSNDLPTTTGNYVVVPVSLASPNWKIVIAINITNGYIYGRMKYNGTWKSWVQLSSTSLNQ